eukprot:TRINITY_DN65281_c0_g1_i1.p1 TRINITY_DN65281_c0_g1~~TRINITY_DN65281_c0_g1_i1.p1  ORF type:complete len:1448 (+),score=315.52 TRINITY_DN65281_c0_g1_i1:96-4439(+)
MSEEEAIPSLRLSHAFGVYPSPLRDAVISVGDDAFLYCVGRHICICDQSRQRLGFLSRDARHRVVTALTKSANGKLLAVGERVGTDAEAHVQISILALPKVDTLLDSKVETKEEALKVLHPANKRLDIIGLAFNTEGKYLVSLSSMPDSTVTFWRWEIEKPVSSRDIEIHVNRLHVNPTIGSQFTVSGPSYLRVWDYNPNDHQLKEHPSLFPLKLERQMKVVDHCWVLNTFLCAASEDGHVYLFEDGEQRENIDVLAVIEKHESEGPKAAEREQAKTLQLLMGGDAPTAAEESPPVVLSALSAWSRGFVVGGNQGYLGIFIVNAKAEIEPLGTFRKPGEKAIMWHMSAGTEDSNMTILSYEEQEITDAVVSTSQRGDSASKRSIVSGQSDRRSRHHVGGAWSLSSFPVGQADLAATGQLEVFSPVFGGGNHHGKITAMSPGWSRRIVATCGEDKMLKVWNYPSEQGEAEANAFSADLSIQASPFETPTAIAVHPIGFQVAIILEDMLRIYHLSPKEATRTHFDLLLKHPGTVAYSNSGNVLAVSTENDMALIDPWRAVVIHMFTGRGGHLSQVNNVLFSEDDRTLLSSGMAPHGAIYGFDLTSETKDRVFEHVSKASTYTSLQYDYKRRLAVACCAGTFRVIGHLSETSIEVSAESRGNGYTALTLAAALGLLFAGTHQGSVRVFRWPITEGGVNYISEIPLHVHGISTMVLSYDARYLFTGCDSGTVMSCEVGASATNADGLRVKLSAAELDAKLVKFRYAEAKKALMDKADREDARKFADLQAKLSSSMRAISANTAGLDDMQIVPKNYWTDILAEIRELEDRMQALRTESDHMLEQKESELQDKLSNMDMERRQEKKVSEDKYESLFKQLTESNNRHTQEMDDANCQFDIRNKKLQEDFESEISKEYAKQSQLLEELEEERNIQDSTIKTMDSQRIQQIDELRAAQERATRDWRAEYDKVCNLLKSDGLKFEEALRQQESEYESQIAEILEHKRLALQVESEKSTSALKDGVSMKQTIAMLQNQVKLKDDELVEALKGQEELRKKLEASQEMCMKIRDQLKERERSLKVKDDSLYKLREQMKHLESFRFVLFHKVRALEEERDPLEEQVNSLKTSVREMYSEFVREFRQKQKLDQMLSDKSTLSSALQRENVETRAQIVQLKKDARRLIFDVENVLHAETAHDVEHMPRRLQDTLDKHKSLACWKPPADDGEGRSQADITKEEMLMEEMATQRNLLFKKHQLANGSATQAKRECATDIRRLTSENAQLIAEMNLLRNENRSFQRSCKEMQADILAMKSKKKGDALAGASLAKSESMPEFSDDKPKRRVPPNGRPLPSGDTPFVRRKIADSQDQYKRQRQKQLNQLPPVTQMSSSPSQKSMAYSQEARFTQSLESLRQDRAHMENQGFAMGKLSEAAAGLASVDGLTSAGPSVLEPEDGTSGGGA